MCGIATNTKPKKQIEDRFSVRIPQLNYAPVMIAKAFANDKLPIIKQQQSDIVQLYEWGLIPKWAHGADAIKKLRAQTINARAETIFEKPSFKESILHQRCLILCDGFIEYQHNYKQKQAYYVQLKNEQLFAMAGVYSTWNDAATNQIKNTFSIVTVPANDLMSIIHNSKKRMPLILPPNIEKDWLQENNSSALKDFFKPYPTDFMKAHPIDNAIGKLAANKHDMFLLDKKEVVKQGSLF
ncbi:MAG: SOS response-associated peptidase [Chitinophagaceae bacterium]|nr:SOS response-associated peptidase [Chitinophagaceae bacterium]